MTDLRDKIIGLLSPDLCCRADRKADAIIALVIKEYEEFVFAIATKVSQRDARIAELEAALAAKTLAELPAHMGMNDYDAQTRISELEAMVADMTAHIRIDPDE